MKKNLLCFIAFNLPLIFCAQENLTPEKLWQLGRVSVKGMSKDGKSVVYSVRTYDVLRNKSAAKNYLIPIAGGSPAEMETTGEVLNNDRISPGGKHSISFKDIKIKKVSGRDYYPDLEKSEVMIYDDLNYRHWDEWEDGLFSHVHLHAIIDNKPDSGMDIMPNEPHDCPQKPFGGDEDAIWSPDGQRIIYVTKKKYGKDYAVSTNTDIYSYHIGTGKTSNLSAGMMGYDMNPAFSSTGTLAWLSMKTDGYESDKNDIIVLNDTARINLTKDWDGTVNSFKWSSDGKKIFFIAPVEGTVQLFEIEYLPGSAKLPAVRQITNGDFDVNGVYGQSGSLVVVTRTDMNHAAEIYTADISTGKMNQLTHVNDSLYRSINQSRIEKRFMNTTDGKKMLAWIIYPPGFDPAKKYPVLLYCQGGPQSALTQFYSFRWNFQLMAASGYIVVAPNRRGMPGHGVEWNAQISKDYGGQVMKDYLTAIDEFSKEPFADKKRLGCIGASFGGYSAFYLAGIHEKRFKTFISHDGIFNWKSMYGTTEEMWFVNWDLGGDYWNKNNLAARKSYSQYDPVNLVDKWDTPILIIQGGKDYRVPIGQGQEAFQAAQLKGIKSRFLYFPYENHWILQAQNALVWQREFYRWLKETL